MKKFFNIEIVLLILMTTLFAMFTQQKNSWATQVDCVEHALFCQIKRNNPKIKNHHAMYLSNVIYKVTKKYKLNPQIFTAILAQESRYKLEARNCTSGYDKSLLPDKVEIKVCSDYGIGQIYYKTAEAYNLDINRLLYDLEYSVEAGAIVLSDFKKRYGHKEDDYWSRYNSSTKTKRNIYKQLVARFL